MIGDKNGVTIDFDGNSKVAYGFTVSLGEPFQMHYLSKWEQRIQIGMGIG